VSDLWVNIALVVLFILIGSFFAAAEIALVSLRESQVERLAGRGRRGRVLVSLEAQPNRFLAAVQVGVTLAGFISAGFGAAQIAPSLAPMLESWGLAESWASAVAFILVTVVIAYASLVIGELVPKRIALQRTESTALLVAVPVDFLARITRPFIWLLSVSTNGIVRILGGNPQSSKEQITGEELRDIVAAHEELTAEERALIDDVFDAGDRELKEVMIPRTETAFLEASMSIGDAAREVASAPHSRYPVIRGSADNVVGVVHIREILHPAAAERGGRVGDLARQVIFFPGTKELIPALTEMRRQRQHLAIIVDEYGGTAGIVALEDCVEEIVGDIADIGEAQIDAPVEVVPGTWRVSGEMGVSRWGDLFGARVVSQRASTVAGLVMQRLSRIARIGDRVELGNMVIEVEAVSGARIESVLVSLRQEGAPA